MKKSHKLLMDKVVRSMDWESIEKVHNYFNLGIGTPNILIPGVKRKVGNGEITAKEIKSEFRSILKHMIENDLPEIHYMYWMIFWTSDDWDFSIDLPDDYDDYPEEYGDLESDEFSLIVKPKIEAIYSPQRIIALGNIQSHESRGEQKEITDDDLDLMLKKAIEKENYEQAAKIRELMKIRNPRSNKDK